MRLEDIMLLETSHYRTANAAECHAHEMPPAIMQFIEAESSGGMPGTVGGPEW